MKRANEMACILSFFDMHGPNTFSSINRNSQPHYPQHTKPRGRMTRFAMHCVTLIALLTLPILHTGCVAVAAVGAGAGAYAVMRGSLDSHVQAGFEETLIAVRTALPRTGLVKVKELSDQHSAKLTFRDAVDTRITLQLTEQTRDLTEVRIRVGAMGNESRSIQILQAIHRSLEGER